MFGFKKKNIVISSPVQGEIMDITEVQDDVFSEKMMGDGFAVEPESDIIVAPCDGTLTLLADTLHAVAFESNGVEILVHIGLDTVALQGKGFEAFAVQGEKVKRGDKLLSFDRSYIQSQGKALTTMLVVTNMDKVAAIVKNLADAAAVLTVDVKG